MKISRLVGLPWLGWCRVVEVAGGRAAIVAFAGNRELLGVWVANDRRVGVMDISEGQHRALREARRALSSAPREMPGDLRDVVFCEAYARALGLVRPAGKAVVPGHGGQTSDSAGSGSEPGDDA